MALLPALAFASGLPDGCRTLALPASPHRRLETVVRQGSATHRAVLAVRNTLARLAR